MTSIFDEWDTRRERAAQPTSPAPPPTPADPADLDRQQRYAYAALEGEVANIIAVPVGDGRNDQLNVSSMKMGHYVAAGVIDERTVIETLGAADGGLDYPATAKTIRSGLAAGMQRAAVIPDGQAPREVAPWEQSDDPFSPNYVAGSAPNATATGTSGRSTAPSDAPARGGSSSSTSSAEAATGSASPSSPTPDPQVGALVVIEATKLRIRREAQRLVAAEDALRDFRIPPYSDTLADELALPDEPVLYRVADLLPTGANAVLIAQFKAGKTTLVSNLARSLVDGVPFLGRFDVTPPEGRVAIFNYEVSRGQYRRWLRDINFANPDRAATLPLRGFRLPLDVPHVEQWVVDWLKRTEATVWIVDPLARAATGNDENDNTAMGIWLDTLDVIKERAGVQELIVPHHTGKGEFEPGQEQGRGATRIADWMDVGWFLTKDTDGTRYFRAMGRDVEVDESALHYDPATRLLRITGGDRHSNAEERYRRAVLTIVSDLPGIGTRELRDAMKQAKCGDAGKVGPAIESLVEARKIHRVTSASRGGKVEHRPGPPPYVPPVEPEPDPFDFGTSFPGAS